MSLSFPYANRMQKQHYKVLYNETDCIPRLTNRLFDHLHTVSTSKEIVILCIGTDRSTGDALGPLVGTKLSEAKLNNIQVYGTLDKPVHAVNLEEKIAAIRSNHFNPFVIAIDACLGQLSSVGQVQIGTGPLKPGAGVKKNLPSVGDLHITGIVNVGGFMEYFVLQNTRLHLVMEMAEVIAKSIHKTDQKLSHHMVSDTY